MKDKIFYRISVIICCAILCLPVEGRADESPDYTEGVFIVNEDWYGHQNSSVNFLTETGNWHYNVFQKENPGKELGCTNQYGTIYGDKFYLVAKQEKDPAASVIGGRFTVCEATTMKCLKQIQKISVDKNGKSNADGRAFLGVTENKGYISTSNGIHIYDMDQMEIVGKVEGSDNPESSGYGSLYRGQVGTMIRVNDYVFAIHQSAGLLIIDAEADTLVRTIMPPEESGTQRGFGSVVLSKDGNLWLSVAANVSGTGATAPYIFKVNPVTFDTLRVNMPDGIYPPANSWYAWTADGFCSSKQKNCLYWNGGQSSWFSNQYIFKYDIDKNEFSCILDLTGTTWKLYGTAFRIHPVTDELYCFYFHEFTTPTHRLVRLDNEGKQLEEYPMIDHYWFPALPVFPDNEAPVVSEALGDLSVSTTTKIFLGDKVSDADNMDAAIVKSVSANSAPEKLTAKVRNDSLVLVPKTGIGETVDIRVKFNSNGKIVTKDIQVEIKGIDNVSINDAEITDIRIYPNPFTEYITVDTGTENDLTIYNISGQQVLHTTVQPGETTIETSRLPNGSYIVKCGNRTFNMVK